MFWKHVKISRLSILNQLMVIYSLSIIGTIIVIALVFYPLLLNIIQLKSYPYLTQKCYLIMSLLLFSVISTVIGYFVSKSGLKKLEIFSLQLKRIKANSLHERILLHEYPHELKLLGESFNEMLDRLESSFKQLSEFSSDIAHELRTPLHNLTHSTERLLLINELPQDCRSLLESNLEEYQHLAKLVKQLLFLAKSENGQILLHKTSVSLREQVMHLLEYYQPMAEEKNITFTCRGDAKACVDVTLFRQLINNLISNALHYTPQGGFIGVNIEVEKNKITLSIQDSGVGISKEDLNRLFERFYRVDKSRTSSSGGLGLGLSIAKSIINLHSGSISIKSELNKGTLVTIQFPK